MQLKIESKKESLAEQWTITFGLGPNLLKNYLDWKSFLNWRPLLMTQSFTMGTNFTSLLVFHCTLGLPKILEYLKAQTPCTSPYGQTEGQCQNSRYFKTVLVCPGEERFTFLVKKSYFCSVKMLYFIGLVANLSGCQIIQHFPCGPKNWMEFRPW